MRTLVVSDLHLGGRDGADVLRRPGPLAALCAHLGDVDRLVLLGDVVELRQGPTAAALDAAEPVLAAIGDALPAGAQVIVVPGNHDHALVAPALTERAGRPAAALGVAETFGAAPSPAAGRLSAALGSGRTTFAYPGVWLREDVYATHGHYLDRLTTLPTLERLASGAMGRVNGRVPPFGATPEDFEAGLAPIYAWLHSVANQPGRSNGLYAHNPSAKVWTALAGERPGRRATARVRLLAALFPVAVGGLNRAGVGPVRADLRPSELRRASLRAMGDVSAALGLRPRHLLFGHTHRAGPLPGDEVAEWRAAIGGSALMNGGAWVDEPLFSRGGPENPYWAGRAVVLDDDAPPRLVRLATDLGDRPA